LPFPKSSAVRMPLTKIASRGSFTTSQLANVLTPAPNVKRLPAAPETRPMKSALR